MSALQDLAKVFSPFGELHSCPFFQAKDAGKNPYGFANFEYPDDAARALEKLDRQVRRSDRAGIAVQSNSSSSAEQQQQQHCIAAVVQAEQ